MPDDAKKRAADREMGRTRAGFITDAQKRKMKHEKTYREMKTDYHKHKGSSLKYYMDKQKKKKNP